MNERIVELSKQAEDYADVIDDERNIGLCEWRKIWQEKFAELIVQECLDILDDEDTGDVYGKSVRLAMIRIKQHFGVDK